jgi:hypothetical protein
MMLIANCKFLMHFNSADRINNRHQQYAKNLRIYFLPRAILGKYFTEDKKCIRYLLKENAPEFKTKQRLSSFIPFFEYTLLRYQIAYENILERKK